MAPYLVGEPHHAEHDTRGLCSQAMLADEVDARGNVDAPYNDAHSHRQPLLAVEVRHRLLAD